MEGLMKLKWLSRIVSVLTLSALAGAAQEEVSSSPQVIIDWNNQVFTACASETVPLPQQRCSRALSMVHLAQHDAVNSVEPYYRRYAYHGRVNHAASPVAAAAYAAHDVLVDRFPSQAASFDALLATSISGIRVKQLDRGKVIGQAAAHAIIARRANDGFDSVVPYTPSGLLGHYAYTPGITVVTARELEFVTPFALERKDQFRASGPYALDSAEYAADFNEVKAIGSLTSTVRTVDQTDAANFWFEATPIGWNRMARTVVADQSVNLYETARAFALLNVALNDSWIAGWDTKFHYDFWRPITAIQQADLDGNTDTELDATWAPLRPTPGVPEYISTHSALGEAAAVVLTETLGPSPFSMTSTTALPAGSTRSFTDFYSASFENTQSRVWVGVHFRKACEDGRAMGHEIGEIVADLLPRRN
jgi:hypothetical protein